MSGTDKFKDDLHVVELWVNGNFISRVDFNFLYQFPYIMNGLHENTQVSFRNLEDIR